MAVTPDQVYGSSQWLAAQPGYANRFSMLLKQYGIIPDAGTLAKYGLSDYFSQDDATAAQNNPYSIAAQLKNTLSGSLTNNATNANSHGALFSGAFKNMQDASGRDYTKNYALAGDAELGGFADIQGDKSNLYSTIYGNLLAQPIAPAPDNGLSISGSGTAADPTIVSNPYVPNPTTPAPAANGNPWNIPDASGAALTVKKPKPVVGGIGHVT